MIDFSQFAPQKMFLMQGDDVTFDEIVAQFVVDNPMTQALSVPRFTIEHARSVAEFAVESTGESRVYIVHFSVFSPDAAQVLLKSLEEPASLTTIIFITRYPYLVPQTVRSRLMLLQSSVQSEGGEKLKTILEAIKKESADKDDDPASRRSRAVALLDELEMATKENHHYTSTIYRAKHMLFKANLPTKYVLDYVATIVR